MSSGLASPLLISVLVHLLGLTALSVMGGSLWSQAPPPDFITTDLVLTPPAPAPAVPVPQPPPTHFTTDTQGHTRSCRGDPEAGDRAATGNATRAAKDHATQARHQNTPSPGQGFPTQTPEPETSDAPP